MSYEQVTVASNSLAARWIKRARFAKSLGLTRLWSHCLRRAADADKDLRRKVAIANNSIKVKSDVG